MTIAPANLEERPSWKNYAMRGALLAVAPLTLAYLGGPTQAWQQGGWMIRGSLLASAPAVLVCGSGAVEGAARAAFNGMRSLFHRGPKAELIRAESFFEVKRTHALMRGLCCPPLGCALFAVEVAKFWRQNLRDEPPMRSLVDDYAIYYLSYQGAVIGVRIGKKGGKLGLKAAKKGLTLAADGCLETAEMVDKVFQVTGVYVATRCAYQVASAVLSAGLGVASSLYGIAREHI